MIDAKLKSSFFDRKPVIDMIGKVKAAALAKAGAFVRRRAKSSIRKRKGVSAPGSPPSSHTGLLRDAIYFSFDQGNASVVVGPEKLNGKAESPDQGTVPGALERGGTVIVRQRAGRRGGATKKTITVKARPFMGPALEAEAPKFPELFGTRGS